MTISLLSFYTSQFRYSKNLLVKSAKQFGIKDISVYNQQDFAATAFYQANRAIASQPRGAGYWLWKPYYILELLKKLDEGDILIYCDSGVEIIASLESLIQIANQSASGIILFENYQGSGYYPKTTGLQANEYNLYTEINKNKYWTKRDAFVLMGLDEERYWNSQQLDANFQMYRKCETAIQFVQEWLDYCSMEQVLTDLPNIYGLPNFDNFFGHIHDQAIISLLAEKHQLELFRCASQYGNHYKMEAFRENDEFRLLPYSKEPKQNSAYGTLLNHHRSKYGSFVQRLRMFFGQEKKLLLN